MSTYSGNLLTMTETSLTDQIGEFSYTDLLTKPHKQKPTIHHTTPLIESLIQIAHHDIENNIVKEGNNTYFGAGRTFGAAVFTRDICFSGILALNDLYPDIMKQSLEFTRIIRRRTAFRVNDEQYIIEGIDAPWQFEPHSGNEHFPAGPVTRRTDDVVFLWGAADWIEKNGDKIEDWKWLFDLGNEFFDVFYTPFYDAKDGLYFGQASFIDVHFPTFKANGYPLDWSISDCCKIKALSTNCLYKIGMDKMAKAASKLGLNEAAALWSERAASLTTAIKRALTLPDGTLAYYKDKNGNVSPQREALGTALAVLSEVVTREEAAALITAFPRTEIGMPLIVPPFDHSQGLQKYNVHYDGIYHNNTTWPFVDAFFCMAYEKATGEDIKGFNLAVIARTCRGQSSFREVTNALSTMPYGSHSQLWSAAAFLNACLRAGILTK